MFRIVFVLDIYNATVVHAQGGERRNYMPVHINSKVCDTSGVMDVVRTLNPQEIYVADLNVLQGEMQPEANREAIEKIASMAPTMLDTGIRELEDMDPWKDFAGNLILGTETCSMETISRICETYPGKSIVSIDRKGGKVLSSSDDIPEDTLAVLEVLNTLDLKDIVYLDLDRVGTGKGVDAHLLGKMNSLSTHNLLLGGGVKNMEDIRILDDIGLAGALVATAVHNGNIPLNIVQEGIFNGR
ncbi:phosphoribosylformimino-5-aminoimidazole carboxamide ribotide isomerase [Methanohalophilus levihalophilus]|uniref:HisA/HisF-related TIM barrel protein n=1 Tax=Methanohalophilus levihalophilus TaxID=1431282 RepID=UPI001AE5952D|nr:HisA/HisF-related TIM barrel protein [Methanohalophilus levihalophilus]MBP2029863.1 phosphoribosylformimino-5-aminoimidazole carboxamide ribotide isomerase [Methanohalophilus levihalophilus]